MWTRSLPFSLSAPNGHQTPCSRRSAAFRPDFAIFAYRLAVGCRCAALRSRSSLLIARCLSMCKTPSSHRHSWTAFAILCCLQCTPRSTATSWSRPHGGLLPASYCGLCRSKAAAWAIRRASLGGRRSLAFGWTNRLLLSTERSGCVAVRQWDRAQ